MTKLRALFLLCLTLSPALSSEPVPYTINTKKWSHVLDDHFISITVNPTDLLQGKVYGLAMNSTMAILKGLAPAYLRIGSADTSKYTFKKSKYANDMVKPDDEYTVTETHWVVFNEVAQSAGLDVIVCLNAAHRSEGTKKWDTRNSLELISFSDSQGYNLTWQLGYEVQSADEVSGTQFGKDLNRLRTILNAFPRYQHAKLIGPDIRVIHKKEDIDFWNDVLIEAGPTLDAVTWHPRWPQPSKMKVSENSDLGYEFPTDYLEWDRAQLNKILQRSVFKNPVWIGETKRESTGTFAEGLIWARRLLLAAKLGVEVVMKQPNLMDISHPKPEYWIALLHKRLLGKAVLETRSTSNNTELSVISHCTNPFYWSDKPEKLQDGAVTIYAINMGGLEQKIHIKGTWTGKTQMLFQYVLTSGSDPDSVFSQMTYLNGEPLMMTDDGLLPDIIPKLKKLDRGLTMKLPPYSIGFWVVPEAKVKICQVQPHNVPSINIETLAPSTTVKQTPDLQDIRDINQFLVDKLTNPTLDKEDSKKVELEMVSSESSEKDINLLAKENTMPRVARRIRQVRDYDHLNHELRTIMQETHDFLSKPEVVKDLKLPKLSKATPSMERRIQSFAEGISDAIKSTNQQQEFDQFLEDSGLKKDFGALLMNDKAFQPYSNPNPTRYYDRREMKERIRRSISSSEEYSQEESVEDESPEESKEDQLKRFDKKLTLVNEEFEENKNHKQDTGSPHQPDLKGLEEKYKSLLQSKIEDGKRKIDDIKRKIKQEEMEIAQKRKAPESVNDIQEEIIKKEIELLEKTEETVADILKNQKKRQENFEDIIFDELNDFKGEKLSALEEMQMKKKENAIVKRQVTAPHSRPLFKTVEYIEKNFNLEPSSVKKIKRSLEERMGELLRSYDTKKSLEIKKRLAPQKEDRKIVTRKSLKESERKRDDYADARNAKSEKGDDGRISPVSKDRTKEKNLIRKASSSPSRSHQAGKDTRKYDAVHQNTEEYTPKIKKNDETKKKNAETGRKTDETRRKPEETKRRVEETRRKDDETRRRGEAAREKDEVDGLDSFEFFNEKRPIDLIKRPDRRRILREEAGDKNLKRIDLLQTQKEERKPSKNIKESIARRRKQEVVVEEENKESYETEKSKEIVEEVKEKVEKVQIPLKEDKNRRENMLKQITSMVDNMHSGDRHAGRQRRMDEDEDISEEFDTEIRARAVNRRPRKADASEFESGVKASEKKVEGKVVEEKVVKDKIVEEKVMKEKPVEEKVAKDKIVDDKTAGDRVVVDKLAEKKVQVDAKTEAPVAPTTPSEPATSRRAGRRRKHRNRGNKKHKSTPKEAQPEEEEDEGPQKKRHLSNLDRPVLEFDKKPLFKPKLRKFSPKFLRYENELPINEKEEKIPSEIANQNFEAPKVVEPQELQSQIMQKELLEDLEEVIEEKLGLESEESKGRLETNKDEPLEEKRESEINFSGETPMPTEGYIIVEPTIETESVEESNAESELTDIEDDKKKDMKVRETQKSESDASQMEVVEELVKEKKTDVEELQTKAKENDRQIKQPESDKVQMAQPQAEKFQMPERKENNFRVEQIRNDDIRMDNTEEIKKEILSDFADSPKEKKYFFSSGELSSDNQQSKPNDMKAEEKLQPVLIAKKSLKDITKNEPEQQEKKVEKSSRIRRATFLPNHGEDEDEDDYSSEERIQKFKQMIYRKSPAKKPIKNDVRQSGGGGLGADEFFRMAGSTVRVMFDDVIPEAYGQTKTKIQNMGISEYIKEFSNIVQQMRNLDQIFLNIGEAAVKGYIRGNRADKGPYIQVISRKKRSLDSEGSQSIETDVSSFETKNSPETETALAETSTKPNDPTYLTEQTTLTTDLSIAQKDAKVDCKMENKEYARPDTSETIAATKRGDDWSTHNPESYLRQNSRRYFEKKAARAEKAQATQKVLTETKFPDQELYQTIDDYVVDKPGFEMVEPTIKPVKSLYKKIPKTPKQIYPRLRKNEKIRDNALNKKVTYNMDDDIREKLSPWIKTTRDFIQEALTTLQRQRELSEILARESINDLMNREITKKGKREVGDGEMELPVYHLTSSKTNKKRETSQKFKDETLIRHLRELQPGVYVVPSEDMTNIRSEQIINEAKKKSGMPNVVTLNIYYDKKNEENMKKAETTSKTSEPEISQDVVAYYQNKAWNAAASQYDQNNQLMSPVVVPDMNIAGPLVPPVQVTPGLQGSGVYAAEPRFAQLPNSRLIQFPSQTYHYPPTQKVHPAIVERGAQQVYGPVFYVPQETRFVPQGPGTKRQWREFKARSSAVSPSYTPGWNIHYETVPSSMRGSSKSFPGSSYNKNFKIFSDKKRSTGDFKTDPNWSDAALPFWKFFTTSSSEAQNSESIESTEKQEDESTETESNEQTLNEKKTEEEIEQTTRDNTVQAVTESSKLTEETSKSRKRRSITENYKDEPFVETERRKLMKRSSYPYHVQFNDHDVLPEWYGTYQEIGNALDDLPLNIRQAQVISSPWTDEDEELLAILDADDELSLIDMDTDEYYYANDNTIPHLKRYPRSTDQFPSAMLQTNMIDKMPIENDQIKHKITSKIVMKKLTDGDSSLEMEVKGKVKTSPEDKLDDKTREQRVPTQVTEPEQIRQQMTEQQTTEQPLNRSSLFVNGTMMLPRNPNDDTFYHLFKYAYDSLVKVMKSMKELF